MNTALLLLRVSAADGKIGFLFWIGLYAVIFVVVKILYRKPK